MGLVNFILGVVEEAVGEDKDTLKGALWILAIASLCAVYVIAF